MEYKRDKSTGSSAGFWLCRKCGDIIHSREAKTITHSSDKMIRGGEEIAKNI